MYQRALQCALPVFHFKCWIYSMGTVGHSMECFLIHMALIHQSELLHSVTCKPHSVHMCTKAENSYYLSCFVAIMHVHDDPRKLNPSMKTRIDVLHLWILLLSAD